MRLFAFQPNGYGQQWFVMSTSREAAIEAVRKWITTTQPDDWHRQFYTERLDLIVQGFEGARIDEHDVDEVVHGEIS